MASRASTSGDIFFVTGNSDYSGDSYNRVRNIAESVVQLSGDLTTVKGLFTPQGDLGWQVLDEGRDFGSGGADAPAAAAGRADEPRGRGRQGGRDVRPNADDLNNGKPKGGKAYSTADIGSCWCGPSY